MQSFDSIPQIIAFGWKKRLSPIAWSTLIQQHFKQSESKSILDNENARNLLSHRKKELCGKNSGRFH
jgi:hypothetical protein